MMPVIQASELTLSEVEGKFNLQRVNDEHFFREWLDGLPELTELEQQRLDRVKAEFMYLSKYPMLEELVKMVVVSPLLSLTGFYLPPFRPIAEHQVEFAVEEDGETLRGRIDVLILQQQLWVTVLETKGIRFDVMEALPQALAYMSGNPNASNPTFGLLTNGNHFTFIKLMQQEIPQYALSRIFSLINPGNDLYEVLKVLKKIRNLVAR